MGNALPTHRQCAVRINNNSNNYTLRNPRVYIHSGRCEVAFPSTIEPSADSSALFTKTPHTARGSVVVFTYNLYNKSTSRDHKKMAVMFSNPYDFNFYSNYYAVGIFDRKQLCDHSLFDKMYYQTQAGFVRDKAGSVLTYSDGDVTISANMTDLYQPELDIDISNRDV